jgi:hypothetical protein
MKKIILLFLVLLFCFINTSVLAENYLGDVTYTDVVAYINHFPIPSYNYKGYTLIAVEDLQDYGFNVKWNEYRQSLCIFRNKENNNININFTFKPTSSLIGKKQFSLINTPVRTYIGNYWWEVESFGGFPGKTLINIDSLTAFGKVAWHPDINAVKVWIEDGLEMNEYMWNIRELDPDFTYYTSCYYADTYSFRTHTLGDKLAIVFSQYENSTGMCSVCSYGRLEVLEVIDSEGNSRKKDYYGSIKSETFNSNDFTTVPYFYNLIDRYLSVFILLDKKDLKPPTKPNGEGLIKLKYSCSCGSKDIYYEMRVDGLPYDKKYPKIVDENGFMYES